MSEQDIKLLNEELKQHAQDLEKNEQRFDDLLSSLQDVVWSASMEGEMQYINRAAQTVYGRPIDEFFTNKNIWAEVVIPEDQDRVLQESQLLFEKGEIETKYRIVRPDGDVRWLYDRKRIIYNEEGEPVRIGGIASDITDQKQAEEQINIFSRFVENSKQGFGMATLDGHITYLNPALLEMLGEDSLDAVHGKPLKTYYTQEYLPMLTKEILPLVMREGHWSGTTELISKFGHRFQVAENYFLIPNDQGEPLFLADVITDISEKVHTEEKLQISLEQADHNQRLLMSLSKAAQSVQLAQSPEDVFDIVGKELTNLGYGSMVFRLSAGREYLEIIHSTYAKEIMKAAENLVGLSAIGHRIAFDGDGRFGKLVERGQAEFRAQAGESLREALPVTVRPVAGQVARMLGIEQSIFAPLEISGSLFGFLMVTGRNMTEKDLGPMCAFATQAAIALENARSQMELNISLGEILKRQRHLLALSEAAQDVQLAQSAEQIYRIVGDRWAEIGYYAAILVLSKDKKQLTAPVVVMDSKLLRKVEKVMGFPAADYSFDVCPDGLYQRVLLSKDALFVEPFVDPIFEALPEIQRPMTEQLLSLADIRQGILAPMRVAGESFGILMVAGNSMTEADIPIVTAFANQSSVALENTLNLESLRESEERYRTLFEAESDTIFMVNESTLEIMDANLAAMAMYGYSRQELLSMSAPQLSGEPDKTSQAIQELSQQKSDDASGRGSVGLRYHKRKDGTIFPVEISANRFEFRGMKINISTIRDISHQVKMEADLSRRLAELEALNSIARIINESIDVDEILNRSVDESLRAIGVEAAAIYLLNEQSDGLELVCHRGLSPEFADAASRAEVGEGFFGRVVQSGQPLVMNNLSEYPDALKIFIEKEQIKSAVVVPLQATDHVLGSMGLGAFQEDYFDEEWLDLFSAIGNQIAIGVEKVSLYNETNSLAAELEQRVEQRTQQLRVSEEKFRVLVDNASEAIIATDMNFIVTSWNLAAEKMYGWKADEVIDKPFAKIVKPKYPKESRGELNQHLVDHGMWRGEAIHHRRDGTEIFLNSSVSVIKNEVCDQIGVVAINQDITNRKITENELAKHMEELERFNRLALGREQRVIELKQSVNQLLVELGRQPEFEMSYLEE